MTKIIIFVLELPKPRQSFKHKRKQIVHERFAQKQPTKRSSNKWSNRITFAKCEMHSSSRSHPKWVFCSTASRRRLFIGFFSPESRSADAKGIISSAQPRWSQDEIRGKGQTNKLHRAHNTRTIFLLHSQSRESSEGAVPPLRREVQPTFAGERTSRHVSALLPNFRGIPPAKRGFAKCATLFS